MILSGNKSAPETLPVGDKIHITCNTGYNLEGESDLICETDHCWNKPIPICVSLGELME
jgi:hypothetical protein